VRNHTLISCFITIFLREAGITIVDRTGPAAAGIITVTEDVVFAGDGVVGIDTPG
jgi:hypothetical protein